VSTEGAPDFTFSLPGGRFNTLPRSVRLLLTTPFAGNKMQKLFLVRCSYRYCCVG